MISPLYFVAVIVLVCLSAFFSASEMSFSSTNKLRLENMVDDGIGGAKLALKVAERFDDALSAILIGNNLVNIAMSSIGSVMAILIAGEEWTWLATAIITVLVIIFGETMPKIVAKKNANKLVLVFCYPIYALTVILKPLIWLVVGLANLIMMLLPKERTVRDEDEAQQELQSIIETAEDENVLDEDRSELVQNALEFGDTRVSEVMTARVDIEAIDIEDSFEDILEQIEGSTYSRLPVYEDGIDNVIGILYLNKFYRNLTEQEAVEIRSVLSKPIYVYKTTKLPAALKALRSAKQHLAIVTDEYGGTLGIVTMEDILEQLVGEIWDENDIVEEDEVVEHSNGVYELDGDMQLSDFCELMDWDEDNLDAESATVGGWTIEVHGDFPKVGEGFTHDGVMLEVLEMDGLRVSRVLVKKIED
ncbi:MAG: HlyC/CorC family transporter [Oscillospiraceae bacterium]|nr:HlyC/CorC family transporter [Oscillospiraceae bacterium]